MCLSCEPMHLVACSLRASYSPKRVNICARVRGPALWFHSYPQLGNQWSACAWGGELPQDCSHLHKSSLFRYRHFFLRSVRWDHKAQMCHILWAHTGSSHTNNQRRPKGRVMPAICHASEKQQTTREVGHESVWKILKMLLLYKMTYKMRLGNVTVYDIIIMWTIDLLLITTHFIRGCISFLFSSTSFLYLLSHNC